MTDGPDEIVEIAYCPGCELPSIPYDPNYNLNKLRCPRCGSPLGPDDFYDYADLRVVDYE